MPPVRLGVNCQPINESCLFSEGTSFNVVYTAWRTNAKKKLRVTGVRKPAPKNPKVLETYATVRSTALIPFARLKRRSLYICKSLSVRCGRSFINLIGRYFRSSSQNLGLLHEQPQQNNEINIGIPFLHCCFCRIP